MEGQMCENIFFYRAMDIKVLIYDSQSFSDCKHIDKPNFHALFNAKWIQKQWLMICIWKYCLYLERCGNENNMIGKVKFHQIWGKEMFLQKENHVWLSKVLGKKGQKV